MTTTRGPNWWDQWYLGLAEYVSSASKDPSTKVGCVVVGPDNAVRVTGYNGPPPRVHDLPERFERPAKYLYTNHAERAAIDHAARNGVALDGCRLYVTHFPCNDCAKSIIAAGITRITYGPGKTSMPDEVFAVSQTMLNEAGVETEAI